MRNSTINALACIATLRVAARFLIALLMMGVMAQLNSLRSTERLISNRSVDSLRLLSGFVRLGQEIDDLPIGAHLVSPRSFYMHHGIYLGRGEVVHYSGFSSSLKAGPVEITDLIGFASRKPVWLMQEQGKFSNDEIVKRARSRVGECQYRLLSNNCEHFCSWCINGKGYSAQINAYVNCPRFLFSLISFLKSRFVA